MLRYTELGLNLAFFFQLLKLGVISPVLVRDIIHKAGIFLTLLAAIEVPGISKSLSFG